jgi:hypothetical protein
MIVSAGPAGAGEHVLAGARLFRAERYAEALVEFRVAERLGSAQARGYVGATLVKLDRPEQAVEAFEAPGAPAPGDDALLDYYHALACHEARLYLRADRLLETIGARAGPRIGELARQVRADIAAALASPPSRAAIDWYLARCDDNAAGHAALARAQCEEAAALGARRADRYGVAEAHSRAERLKPARAEAR